ncbi:serpin family protein [Streptomyces plumbiresistens]|uniref:Serpin domain-containing protein n=1 Tax=Streptomyces plumbiresistens TaxID=511811 RepID=A0ABP7Q2L8_9ACTN
MPVTNTTIRAANALTARWAGSAEGGTVFSAPGVWPLLAFLADGATGAARAEIAQALGVPAGETAAAGRELLAAMAHIRGLDTAVGLWTERTLEPREEWEAALPAGTRGVLTGDTAADQEALDAWAAKRTDGMVERMPVALTDRTKMVLASALALRTEWLRPFREGPLMPQTGPWQGRVLRGLRRSSELLDRVGVADTPHGHVTELKVLGDTAVDVHLLLGEEGMTAGQVLGAGVDVLARRCPVVAGSQLPYGEVGPGLHVVKERRARPLPPTLEVVTPAFRLDARHDLLKLPRVFGLSTALDTSTGHFPGISALPLAIGSAQQCATATFGGLGFRAAAVTAVAAQPGSAPPALRWTTTSVRATFDRPFGFLAMHRASRLVLAAGWVTDPTPFREDGRH